METVLNNYEDISGNAAKHSVLVVYADSVTRGGSWEVMLQYVRKVHTKRLEKNNKIWNTSKI